MTSARLLFLFDMVSGEVQVWGPTQTTSEFHGWMPVCSSPQAWDIRIAWMTKQGCISSAIKCEQSTLVTR